MEIQSFYEPDSGTWTHLLADSSDKVAAIIDPVWVFDPVSGIDDTAFIAKVLAAAGISVIKFHDDYKNDPLVFDLLGEAGVAILKN